MDHTRPSVETWTAGFLSVLSPTGSFPANGRRRKLRSFIFCSILSCNITFVHRYCAGGDHAVQSSLPSNGSYIIEVESTYEGSETIKAILLAYLLDQIQLRK